MGMGSNNKPYCTEWKFQQGLPSEVLWLAYEFMSLGGEESANAIFAKQTSL